MTKETPIIDLYDLRESVKIINNYEKSNDAQLKPIFPHSIRYSDELQQTVDTVATLLNLDNKHGVWVIATNLLLCIAKNQIKGLEPISLKPELIKLIQDHPKFFETLCEEGVVDWLESFVIKKQNSNTLEQ